jgi:hypothetical protein
MRSGYFRTWWAAVVVRFHLTGKKRLHHPLVGALDLDFAAMDVQSASRLTVVVDTAAPGTATSDALKMLDTWAAQDPIGHASVDVVPRKDIAAGDE